MYTRYARKSAFLVCFLLSGMCLAECEILRNNCTNYKQIYKENLRNCLVNVTDRNILHVHDGGVEGNREKYPRSTEIPYASELPSNHQPTNVENRTNWELQVTNDIAIFVNKLDNDSITIELKNISSTSVEARKKKMRVNDIIPYLIIPGFIMAGMLPWLIPGLKMTVMAVAMVNQMAFTSSLFALIRGYIFDTSKEEHVVYVNHGYNKYKHMKNPHEHR